MIVWTRNAERARECVKALNKRNNGRTYEQQQQQQEQQTAKESE